MKTIKAKVNMIVREFARSFRGSFALNLALMALFALCFYLTAIMISYSSISAIGISLSSQSAVGSGTVPF